MQNSRLISLLVKTDCFRERQFRFDGVPVASTHLETFQLNGNGRQMLRADVL